MKAALKRVWERRPTNPWIANGCLAFFLIAIIGGGTLLLLSAWQRGGLGRIVFEQLQSFDSNTLTSRIERLPADTRFYLGIVADNASASRPTNPFTGSFEARARVKLIREGTFRSTNAGMIWLDGLPRRECWLFPLSELSDLPAHGAHDVLLRLNSPPPPSTILVVRMWRRR
jgi:hypothetical protein